MKDNIHPKYHEVEARCACGARWKTRSTKPELHLEICSNCHPFFTGKQKLMDTAGRIEKFKTRYAATPAAPKAEAKAAPAPAKKAEAPKENRAAKRAKAGKSKPKTEAAPAEAAAEPKAE